MESKESREGHQVAQDLVNAVGGAPVPEAVQEELSAAVAGLTGSPPAERDAASCTASAGSASGRE
jgi:hypothetical protein